MDVFAVESDSVQVSWSALPGRRVTIEMAGQSLEVDSTPPPWYGRRGRAASSGRGGPGAAIFGGLEADTSYEVTLSGAGFPRRLVGRSRTLPEGPGALLSQFATVSDCHIGQSHLGLLGRIRDPQPLPDGLDPYPERSLRAAIGEAEQWGAQILFAKGDLTEDARPRETERLVSLFEEATVPVHAILGNHDVRGTCDVATALTRAGVDTSDRPRAVDLPGVRVVLGHSPVIGSHAGRLDPDHLDALEKLAAGTGLPVVVILHHPPRLLPVPTSYPPGINWRDSAELTRRLRGANPSVVVIAGHTHRNRRYRVRGIDVVEVGSTKDYPGQWAGYSVYEGGIRQVVRRVSWPDVIVWTEMTGRALGGLWRRWSPGSLAARCWTIDWPSGL